MKIPKKFLFFVVLTLQTGLVSAEEGECSITNLGACIVEKFFEFVLYILNLPVRSLLSLIERLMTQPVNIDVFFSAWSSIIYVLSLFYGLLLLFIGFKFLLAGESLEKREKAKSSLANIIIMIILVQTSFWFYSLILEVLSAITKVVFKMVDKSFFVLTTGSFSNIGLELVLLIPYVIVLVSTIILLTLRYICVSVGVIFFTLGIFFYFISPLNQYGRLIINGLLTLISLPFFYAIVFLASSKLIASGTLADYKIVVMIGAFGLINLFTLLLLLFVIIKAATKVSGPAGQIVKVVNYVT